ncbi:hypothetical protein NP233_g732 [Leucocoprinus birnbaumii]|uniref:Protein YOP1 n=1 Tax=Leucocoprinus birnbaumii TaxID=56174 RepID=A0AAD5W2B1_9AGAR|nr:hypothetical protein NP233_g732 [Leucocoprinus birnbaumii]
MLMSFLSHILSAWFAFLLPSYATFKALSHRPVSEPELQRWAMYWSVVGAFVAFEYTAEWLISCQNSLFTVPRSSADSGKSEALSKMARVITISPSASVYQGSTYIYTTYLQPFFVQNEADLDEGIVQAQKNVLTFVQTRITALWEYLLNAANKRQATSAAAGSSNSTSAPNTNASPLQSVYGLWETYGPSVLSALGTRGSTAVATSSSVQGASGTAAQRGKAEASDNNNSHSNAASPASTPSGNPNPPLPRAVSFLKGLC